MAIGLSRGFRATGSASGGTFIVRIAKLRNQIPIDVRVAKNENSGLASFHSRYEPVVTTRWRDFGVRACEPWCQAPMLAPAIKDVRALALWGGDVPG